jgi:hypothetical protein
MYVARFSYDFAPKDRDQAMDLIRRELRDAQHSRLTARLLVPFTRSPTCSALQFEIEMTCFAIGNGATGKATRPSGCTGSRLS